MFRFIRFSRQSYWKEGKGDDILINNHDGSDEEGWEFSLGEVDLGSSKAIKIQIFEDAVIALKNLDVVNALVSLKGCGTLDNAEKILRKYGFEEKIE